MAWDDLGKTLNTFVEERLLSPLLATFVVSWSIWNYKFLVILFSLHSVPTTFKLIETVAFPNWQTKLLWGFAYPMLTTVAYLYIYPWFAAIALDQWKRSQLKLTKIRRKYDDETPVSQEEARELRAAKYAAEEQLEKARLEIGKLRSDLLEARRQEPTTTAEPPNVKNEPGETKPPRIRPRLTAREREVLQHIADNDGRVPEWAVIAMMKDRMQVGRVESEYVVTKLLEDKYLEREFAGDEVSLAFTQRGRQLLYGTDPAAPPPSA